MATYLTDKCNEIRNWFAIGEDVYPDPIVTSWIRMAEEYLSSALRVKHMVQVDHSTLVDERVPLPKDWQEIRLVRLLPNQGVCRYQTPDAFYNPEYPDPPFTPYTGKERKYTILGNFLVMGEVTPAGLEVELTYYQDIPPLTNDNNNWINFYHPTIFTLKILHIAALYAIEDERAPVWNQEVVQMISTMNLRHQMDKHSGSVLNQTRRKSFG